MTPATFVDALRPSRVASLLPVVACGSFLLLLLASGAPRDTPDAARARQTVEHLGVGSTTLVALALIVVALLLDPAQLRLVRWLEGDWPRALGGVGRLLVKRQRDRHGNALGAPIDATSTPAAVQAAGARQAEARRRFPGAAVTRPTALGNALAAMEERAGRRYGWDAVVVWPRLYPVLSPDVRAVVDGQRDRVDATARLAVTAAATTVLSLALLATSGRWMLLALVPAVVGRAAYRGCVHAALAYGQAVDVAFDLHRFDLLRQLHLPLPTNLADERAQAENLSLMWRQDVPITLDYDHPEQA